MARWLEKRQDFPFRVEHRGTPQPMQTPSHTARGPGKGAAAVSGGRPVGESFWERTVLQCNRSRCSSAGSCRQWMWQNETAAGAAHRPTSRTAVGGGTAVITMGRGGCVLYNDQGALLYVWGSTSMGACCSDPCRARKGHPGPSHALLYCSTVSIVSPKSGGGCSGFVA